MRIGVIGASAAGLLAAMMLARAGHEVVVLDRDGVDPAPDIETAASTAFRAAAPHLVQPHGMQSLFCTLVREHLPDVFHALLDAGVQRTSLAEHMPPTLADRSIHPGDERFVLLFSRRATIDWVLRRAAAAERGVTVRGNERVIGLLAEPGDPPHVIGVRTEVEALRTDLVVDASGRRGGLDTWLAGIGARPSAMSRAECGLSYYSRQYRLRTRTGLPGPVSTRVVVPLDRFVMGIWGADNSAMQIAIAPLAADSRFRRARDPGVFTAVLRTVPLLAPWLDVLEPITKLHVMAGLHNTLRRLVIDGRPVATGLHAVGDTVCTTNPTMGRGMSLLMRNNVDLLDVLDAHPDEPLAQTLAMDQAVTEHIEPWYADQAAGDASLLALYRHNVLGEPPPKSVLTPDRLSLGELRTAAAVDSVAFRGYWTVFGVLGEPDAVYRNPELIERARAVLTSSSGLPRLPQPTLEQLTEALESVPA